MTESEPRQPDQAMLRYVAGRLPAPAGRGAISEAYARFYAPLAIASILLGSLPPFVSHGGDGGSGIEYGTVFAMAGRPGGGPAVVGLLLLAALTTLLAIAAIRVRSVALPVSLVIVAALIALMLVTKPGTGVPTPPLSDSGVAGLVLTMCVVALGVAHTIHLSVARRRP